MHKNIKEYRIDQIKDRFLEAEKVARVMMEFKKHTEKDIHLSNVYKAIQKHFQSIVAGRSDKFTEITHNEVMRQIALYKQKLE